MAKKKETIPYRIVNLPPTDIDGKLWHWNEKEQGYTLQHEALSVVLMPGKDYFTDWTITGPTDEMWTGQVMGIYVEDAMRMAVFQCERIIANGMLGESVGPRGW